MPNPPPSSTRKSICAQERTALSPPSVNSGDIDARRALRILVVDDLVDAAESLAVYLRMLGHTVRTAYDGSAAITAASQFGPHVILLDIGLPKLDGYRVAEQMRQNPELQSVCLIAVSGFGQAEDIKAAWAAGFDHHFIKPVEPALLLPILQGIAANLESVPRQ